MSPNEKKIISLKMNSIHDSWKQIKIPWKIKWELKVFLNTGQSFRWARGYAIHFGVHESPSMRLLQDEVKRKKNRCLANNYKFVSQISLRHHSSSRRPRSCKAFGRTSGSCSKHNCIISRSYNRKRKKKSEKEKWKREVYFVFLPTDRQT